MFEGEQIEQNMLQGEEIERKLWLNESSTQWGWTHFIKKDRFNLEAKFKIAFGVSTSWSRYFVRVKYILKCSILM